MIMCCLNEIAQFKTKLIKPMMLIRQHKSSSKSYRVNSEPLDHLKNFRNRGDSHCQRKSPKQASKFHLKHLSSLLQSTPRAETEVKNSGRDISARLGKEVTTKRKKEFKIRRGQSSIGKVACEDNFAYHDWVRKNRESTSNRSIGQGEDKIEEVQITSSSPRICKQNSEKYKQVELNQLHHTPKMTESQSKNEAQPLTFRDRLNRKRYRDLSARELIYDDESEDSLNVINSSVEQAIDRLLSRNRAVTEGSIFPNSRW